MDYHSDRFADHSLLFFHGNKLIAIMPANARDNVLFSHSGLTFGGILSDRRMTTPRMLEIFSSLQNYLIANEFERLVYKTIPHIYHDLPAEEDLYALFVHGARLIRRDVSSTICASQRLPYKKGRKWAVRRSKEAGMEVKRSDEFATFMSIEEAHLQQKHGVRPIHTADEMKLLASRFPENIKLFVAYKDDTMLGGTIVYESRNVAHAQYISATEQGFEVHALDFVLDFLIGDYYADKKYFDFGISTEQEGRYLNRGLIQNKEGFGARATVYDSYELDLAQ
jgi:hypothetical protein